MNTEIVVKFDHPDAGTVWYDAEIQWINARANQCTAEVAVLFAREDSGYKEMPGVDVWDKVRDATTYNGAIIGWLRLRGGVQ